MKNEMDTGFDAFMEAFEGDVGYQADAQEDTDNQQQTQEESGEETDATAEETAVAETAQKESGTTDTKTAGEDGSQDQAAKTETEVFTLKVNKQERTCTREEVISLAQKGADYDRVKDQLTQERQNSTQLQSQLDSQKETMEILEEIANGSNTKVADLLDSLRVASYRRQGLSEDAANERLLRVKAERETAKAKAGTAVVQDTEKDARRKRVEQDLADFRNEYPDVQLSDELLEKLMPDIEAGRSMLQAYGRYESAQKDARIAQLEQQLAAEKQNNANRASSPGSQQDTGGRKTQSDFEKFMEAFE